MSSRLMEYFNKTPRLGTLSTAGKDGTVNVGVFGSPIMEDEKTITMGLGNNRTFRNLQENPHAVFIVMDPGESPDQWKGVRVYLKMSECLTSGEKLDKLKERLGPYGAMMQAAVTFGVTELRPILDMGQGWEASI